MYYEIVCKKDCIHRENGICKFGHRIQNSIFQTERRKCIYYASAFNKDKSVYDSVKL